MLEQILPFLNTALLALGGGIGVYLWRAERRLRNAQAGSAEADTELTRTEAAEKIKELSMGLLEPLEEKIAQLESSNEELTAEVARLRSELEQYIRHEAQYQAELHGKDREISELSDRLAEAKIRREALERRIEHLEDVCRRAGINGEEL